MTQRAYIRTTRVNGRVTGPQELIVDGMKVADLSRDDVIALIAQAALSLRDDDGKL